MEQASFAEIAQLVEHDLAKVGVASSSLVFRSRYSETFFAIFRWRRNLHFCVVTGGALYEKSFPLQPPKKVFFAFLSQVLKLSARRSI